LVDILASLSLDAGLPNAPNLNPLNPIKRVEKEGGALDLAVFGAQGLAGGRGNTKKHENEILQISPDCHTTTQQFERVRIGNIDWLGEGFKLMQKLSPTSPWGGGWFRSEKFFQNLALSVNKKID
jgi:hypothetical protein